MPRPTESIKTTTKSFKTTQDMARYINEAAQMCGLTDSELCRISTYEAAREIHTTPAIREELRQRMAL